MIIDIFQQNVVYIHERNNIMDTKKELLNSTEQLLKKIEELENQKKH